MDHAPAPADAGLLLHTHFVRGRNALAAQADFGPLYVDYYLHLADHGLRVHAAHDALMKETLAALLLHAAGRPWNETCAWTLHLQEPFLNLFATVDNELGRIAGQAFTEDIKDTARNLFFADVIAGHRPRRRSVVEFSGSDLFAAVETFYAQSEQRTARIFRLDEEEFLMVSAQPDCDEDWLRDLDLDAARRLAENEELSPLEQRAYRWECGCSQDRMMEVLAPTMRVAPEELFAGEDSLRIHCPRCGARHAVTREALEAWIARHPEEAA